jgi:hypothetical protein
VEHVVNRGGAIAVMIFALAVVAPAAAYAQATAPADGDAGEPSSLWLVLGGASTTLRGDCQESCVAHGTGDYLHTGSVAGIAGASLNRQMDVGAEVLWVPATATDGSEIRTTFVLGAAQFRPWQSHGLFVKGGIGIAFVRNFVYGQAGIEPPITSKALGLSYAAGWAFRRAERVGLQIFGAQHVAALGDFQTGGANATDVIANFWSLGAAIVIR